MKMVRAIRSGLWSDPTTWEGGQVPGPGAIVVANGRRIGIDIDAECDEVTTAAVGGAVSGGRFILFPGRTLIAAVGGPAPEVRIERVSNAKESLC